MAKTKKINSKTQLIKKSVELESAKDKELRVVEEQDKVNLEQQKQKRVNYEDLKLALVQVSEQMKKFLAENVGDYRIRRVYKINYDIERLIKGF